MSQRKQMMGVGVDTYEPKSVQQAPGKRGERQPVRMHRILQTPDAMHHVTRAPIPAIVACGSRTIQGETT